MKLSVSLPNEDVATLDEFANAKGLGSRSAALSQAVGMLRHLDLERDYEVAWNEWERSGEHAAWEMTTADGLDDASG